MLIVMKPSATAREIAAVANVIEAIGFRAHAMPGATRTAIGITGNEAVTIRGLTGLKPRQKLIVTIASADGKTRDIEVLCRIDTEEELSYYRHGGILPFVLRNLASAA